MGTDMTSMTRVGAFAAVAASLLLAGCGVGPLSGASGCLDPDGQAVAVSIIREEVEKRAAAELRDSDGRMMTSLANLRASLALIGLTVEDVRTTKEDPDSTRKFCAASLAAAVPETILADAQASYEAMDAGSLNDLAEQNGFTRAANRFTAPMDFSVQPTDDGKKIYAEIEETDALVGFLSEVVVAHLVKDRLLRIKADNEAAQAEQTRLNDEAMAAQRTASLAEARTESELAQQSVRAVWAAIDKDNQDRLTANQTAWNQRKRAECNLEAAQTSTDESEREAARLRCDARMTRERVSALRPYAAYNY